MKDLTTNEAAPTATQPITPPLLHATTPALHQPVVPPPTRVPALPLTTVEASTSWVGLNLRDLWAYRELLYFLTWRDVKVRYKQTVLGAAWAILQPLFMMLIFSLFFGRLAGVDSLGVPYPLFAFAGLVPWTFFANAVSNSGNSLVGSANLITKVYFPRLLVPAAAVAAGLVDFLLAFALLVALMFYYRVPPSIHLLLLPVLVLLTALFAGGVGLLASAMNVKYRDVRYALPFMLQLWLFVSSVILPSSAVAPKWRWVLALNPMSGIIEGYRSSLFNLPFDWLALLSTTALTSLVLIAAAFLFRRMERQFADVI